MTVRGLAFGPTAPGVDGVLVLGRAGITIAACEFDGLGGIALAVNHVSMTGLSVIRNVITNSGSTGMYFGCHEGVDINAADPEIGYGLQVKLNSTGIIRNNVIVDTKGPGIMVYGSRDELNVNVVERNVVMGPGPARASWLAEGPRPCATTSCFSTGTPASALRTTAAEGSCGRSSWPKTPCTRTPEPVS